jgi:hypothetical protein
MAKVNPVNQGRNPEALPPSNDPQRKTRRFPHREAVKFLKPYEFEGVTVDIGAGGVGVEVPLAIANGVAVVLEIFDGHAIAQGTVRWGKPHEDRFRIGVQFAEEDWSIIARVRAMGGLES